MTDDRPIGVLDSGIGGLTLFKALRKALPNESFIYVGDTARIPYGTRNEAVIESFTLELVEFLLRSNVKAIVVACNTISATVLPAIREFSRVPVFDVISPVVDRIKQSEEGRIAVFATPMTVKAKAYSRALPRVKVTEVACPLIVPFVEEGMVKGKLIEAVLKYYVARLGKSPVNVVILACTHYPILQPIFSKLLGANVRIIDSAELVAGALRDALTSGSKKLLPAGRQQPTKSRFYFTDTPLRSRQVAENFLGHSLTQLQHLDLNPIERTRVVDNLRVRERFWQGSNTPVIILHGWGSGGDRWIPIAQRLHEAGHCVYVLDLPGFGASEEPPSVWHLAQYSRFIHEYFISLKLTHKKAIIIGHSFGGQIALSYAALFPKSVKKLVLVAAAGIRVQPTLRTRFLIAAAKVGAPLLFVGRLLGLENFMYRFVGRLSGNYDYANASPRMREILKVVVRDNLEETIKHITTPALILWGQDDVVTPIAQGRRMAELLKNSEFTTFPGGHSFYKQQIEGLSKRIVAFIN